MWCWGSRQRGDTGHDKMSNTLIKDKKHNSKKLFILKLFAEESMAMVIIGYTLFLIYIS